MQTNKDLYRLLGLPREASRDDIQRAHRKLVREYHPDANSQDRRAEERFKEIQQAYEVLSDATSDGSTTGGFTPPLKRVRAGHAQEELGQRPEEMPTFYFRFSPRFNPE
jgi:curved DNA-binding protein CbpA